MTITRKKRAFQRRSGVSQFPLLDIQEPNLYRHVFPYDEVCRVEFDNQFIFIDPPEEIFITGHHIQGRSAKRGPLIPLSRLSTSMICSTNWVAPTA